MSAFGDWRSKIKRRDSSRLREKNAQIAVRTRENSIGKPTHHILCHWAYVLEFFAHVISVIDKLPALPAEHR